MGNLIVNIIGVFLLIMLGMFVYLKLHPRAFDEQLEKQAQKVREKAKKADADLLGTRMVVPREGLDGVHVNLYKPHGISKDKYPVVFVAHGGAFMDGDADQLDTFCSRVADQWESIIVNINYSTIDVHPIPYPQEEIRDTVLYFAIHATEFKMDAQKFAMLGFSAGAYLLVGASTFLKEKGFTIKGLIMVSPFVDDTLIRLCDVGAHISPVTIITGGSDLMADRYPVYYEHLQTAGVQLTQQCYKDAIQGFLEYNNPEYENDLTAARSGAVSEEQEDIARACEIWIGSQLNDFFAES